MLKFSANLSMLFTEVPLIDRFQAVKDQGFAAVEIQFPYSLSATAIKQALDETGLKLVLFNVDADDLLQGGEGLACVPDKREQFKQAVAQTVAYAELLQPEVINVLPGRCLQQDRLNEYLDTFQQNLSFAAQAFAPLAVKTVFEAINSHDMPGFIINTGQQMLDVLNQQNNPNLLMQYDIYHAQMMGGNPAEFILQNADKIGHIQFADCPGRGQPGTGQIDFVEVFSAIEKAPYSGWVGAEYKPIGGTADSLGWFRPVSR
ncbi:MAG: TIM barrel protein [Methylococcales bacterium]|nr:TIM barrel protein [Methylococcales bacterium]